MKLFISDLDFTLLDPTGNLPARTAERLNILIQEGLLFTIATARAAPSIRHIMGTVNLQILVIELNGAIIRDLESGHILEHQGLGLENSAKIYPCFEELDLKPYISGQKGYENLLFYPELKNPGMQWFHDEKVKRADPRLRPLPEDLFRGALVQRANEHKKPHIPRHIDDVLSFTYLGTKSEIEQIASLVGQRLPSALITTYPNHYIGGWEIVITAAKANKGHAVGQLLGLLERSHNIQIKETTAFGDSSNDMDMLKRVDVPVAVANASDEIKASAKEIIGHHRDASVLDYLERARQSN